MSSDCCKLIKLKKKLVEQKLRGSTASLQQQILPIPPEDGFLKLLEVDWLSLLEKKQRQLFPNILKAMEEMQKIE